MIGLPCLINNELSANDEHGVSDVIRSVWDAVLADVEYDVAQSQLAAAQCLFTVSLCC
jgi:hypothetical protein